MPTHPQFMMIYPEYSEHGTTILLDDVVKALSIGRRRVYDIVNVLESMEMMVRQAKNKYLWFGKSRLANTLTKLKALALRVYGPNFCNILKQYHHITKKECNESSDCKTDASSDLTTSHTNDREPPVDEVTNSIMDNIISYDMTRRECNRSLGILCQKFIMLFMVSEESPVTLDRAAKLLITEPDEGPGKYKTKVRRLYDIANILTSINFLEKCVSYEEATRKAAYKWVGIDLKSLNSAAATNKAFQTQEFSLTRHSLLSTVSRKQATESPGKDQLKLRSRSVSAHQLTSPENTSQYSGKLKFPRTFSAATVVRSEVDDVSLDDGFDVEKWSSEISSETTERSEFKDGDDSPKESLFKEKLRKLQEEFPDKLPNNGLLELLSACKKKSNEGATRALRRSLSTDFETEHISPQKKLCTESNKASSSVVVQAPSSCNVVSQQPSIASTTFYSALKPLLSYTPATKTTSSLSSENVKIVVDAPRDRHVATLQKWQQPAYLTIPAAFKPGCNQLQSGLQSSLLVSPIGAPITIAKNGFYQIIPVQCQSLNDQSDIATMKAVPIVINKPAVALSTYRPNVSPVTSSVTISPKPPIRRNLAGPVISVSENYPEFVTPPHVLVRNNNVKPQANPIIFPKMTPETPSTSSYSLMNAVTRKLMSFQGEGNS